MPIKESTIVDIREEMARLADDESYSVTEVAKMFGVTRPTVRMWRDRYRASGRSGLEDRSHAPLTCPHRTDEAAEQLILEDRKKWGWGSKKILARLAESHPHLSLPARSTADALLVRHGLVKQMKPRREQSVTPFARRYTAHEPGELNTIDYKGEFRLLNGRYCYPLTIIDHVSRYILACEALDSTSFARAWPVIERVFREHGLPRAMQSDNGPPFGVPNGGRFSRLSVELMSRDVQPIYSRPGVPQDNGSHERMHKDLKSDTARKPARTFAGQQKLFDAFIHKYNLERPHEALSMKRPATVYTPSPRPYPKRVPRPEYRAHWEKRLVSTDGSIKWRNHPIYIGLPLAGHTIALELSDHDLWTVHFHRFTVGKLDDTTNKFI